MFCIQVQAERERRMAEAAMLERHIMQARAKAMAEDEKILNRAAEGCDIYHDLGLPPGKDFFLLKSHCTICSYLRPLYSKQCLVGTRWSPMVPFFVVNWELIWWNNQLSVTMQGGLIPPGQTSADRL